MKRNSVAMTLLNRVGLERWAWSLRRLHCPVPAGALVLEVGAGGNPYPRANVLLDANETSVDRIEQTLLRDRPLVLGLVENLPFRDKSFDFVIASHVLEHTDDPRAFLSELQRVAKAGYLETPDAFFERINPYTYHRLEVTDEGGRLRIWKKPSWDHASEMMKLYQNKLMDARFLNYLRTHPEPFYTRFYWSENIAFEIVNDEVDAAWPLPQEAYTHASAVPGRSLREAARAALRWLFSQNRRNQKLEVASLLRCPSCRGGGLEREDDDLRCTACDALYDCQGGVPRLFPPQPSIRAAYANTTATNDQRKP